jgi:hypothetical protein
MASIRIHSPLPYGFDVGGAFSPRSVGRNPPTASI